MTPAGTSVDVQNGWEENTHTVTLYAYINHHVETPKQKQTSYYTASLDQEFQTTVCLRYSSTSTVQYSTSSDDFTTFLNVGPILRWNGLMITKDSPDAISVLVLPPSDKDAIVSD